MAMTGRRPVNVFGATLSRRQFMRAGGVLAVGGGVAGTRLLKGDAPKPLLKGTNTTIGVASLTPSACMGW